MYSEKTPLNNSTARAALSYPYYGNDNGVHPFYTRRQKDRQLQCIGFIMVITVFIMALVVAVSYSINELDDPLVADSTNPEEVPPPPSLTSTGISSSPELAIANEITSTLSTEEWNEAIKAGKQAIASRQAADALATPLPAPSPDSRHQYAVKTSLQAGKLALAGVGELAATRSIEASRTKLGTPSSIGSYFKNIWAPEGTCKEFSKISCPPSKYRNFDGTCNHPRQYGSALTPFIRKLPPAYADGVEAPRTGKFGTSLPSAREISLKVHPPSPSSNPSFTVMLAVFGQFLDHDITATALSQGTNGTSLTCCPADTHEHPECFPVQVGTGDPVYDLAGRNCMEFVRSAPALQCKIGPRQQLNQVTSFIDGSVIYGPDIATAQSLREGQGGLLRMFKTPDNRTLLPQSTDPKDGCNRDVESTRGRYCFASGDGRANENLHLTTMHLLWARQHNRIAKVLANVNPTWSDEKIYQETRRIVGAQLQHITYKEFVPTILGEKAVAFYKLKPLTSGFRPRNNSLDVNPAVANSFAAAAFRFAHTLLPGLMKVTNAEKSTPSYVELHRMLFNPYSLYSKGGMESSLNMATSNSIQKTSTHVTSQLTKHLFEDPLSNATIPCGLDLVSLNIQRGRDHGLPGYTAWRQYCGLGKVNSFAELQGELDPEALDQISKLYAHVDDVDLYTGALAESDKADGLVGPTFRCLIGDQFSRIQKGDRFWYEVPGEPQSFSEGQLSEIRKTTLAKLICDCSDEISQIQPLVMRSVSNDNPMTSCEDIPEPDLIAWKEASSTVLKATAPEMPATWINFKEEINKTVQGIIDYFGKTPPAPGSPDWADFKVWVNKSFADIRSEISTIYPKPVLSATSSNFNDKEVTFKQSFESPASAFNTKADAGSKQFGNFNYMQFVMNRSLSDLSKYSKTATTQSTTYDDWITFKNDIKMILNDALMNATGTPTDDQREELKKQIAAEIEGIKSGIASIKSVKLSLIKGTAFEGTAADSDWLSFKGDVVKAVTDAVDRIKSKSPPPGDPAWANFGLEIKNQFASVKNYIPVLPPRKLMAGDPSAAAYWDNFRDSLNKSISNAVADIDGNMPAPGDPAWANFGANIKDQFSGFTNYPSLQAKDPSAKASKTKDPAIAAYWDNFKNSLNKSINNAVADIATKSPPPGDPAWSAFGAKIMNDFLVFKNKFAGSTKQPILESAEMIKDPAIAAFWDDFRTSLNSSVSKAVADIAGKNLLPGDPAWANFGANIKDQFSRFTSYPSLQAKDPSAKASKTKDPAIAAYWDNFKNSLNKSINNAVADIATKSPPPGDPAWSAFGAKIMNDFLVFKNKFAGSTKQPILESAEMIKDPAIAAFWDDFRTSLNSSVSKTVADVAGKNLPPGDPAWANFGANIKDRFSGFMNYPSLQAKDPSAKASKTKDPAIAAYWDSFKDSLNKSINNAVADIATKSPPPGDPAWSAFGAKIMNDFLVFKNKFAGSKKQPILATAEMIKDPEIAAFWDDFRTSLNSSVSKAVADIAGKSPPPGDPAWATFGMKIMTDFAGFKDKFTGFYSVPGRATEKTSGVKTTMPFDWYTFKTDIITSVVDTVNTIKKNMPPPGSPAWAAFKGQVMNGFAKIPSGGPSLKASDAATPGSESPKGGAFDWLSFKNDINKSVNEIVANKVTPANFPPGDPRWADFGAQFAKFNTSFEVIKSDIDKIRPKPEESQFAVLKQDWMDFKEKINKSLATTIDLIKSKAPSPGDPAWVTFKNSIEDEFAALKNEINFVKSEASLKASGKVMGTIVSFSNTKKTVQDEQGTQTLPDFSSDLFSLQQKANKTLLQLKKNISAMKLGATVPVISAADWIAFKQEINDAVASYVNSFNSTQAGKWTDMKDFVKTSFAELRNEIIVLRNKTFELQEKSAVLNTDLRLQAKKPKDLMKDGQTLANDKAAFDWETLKSDVNSTVQSLLDDIKKIIPSKTPSKTLKDSLLKAQNKFASLQLSPGLTVQAELPTDWAVFVNGINKTLTGVMKKINALKPVDVQNSVALKNYENEVSQFFDEVKDVVERKKIEFAAATSTGASISNVFRALMTIFPVWFILNIV